MKPRILIVDDEPVVADTLALISVPRGIPRRPSIAEKRRSIPLTSTFRRW